MSSSSISNMRELGGYLLAFLLTPQQAQAVLAFLGASPGILSTVEKIRLGAGKGMTLGRLVDVNYDGLTGRELRTLQLGITIAGLCVTTMSDLTAHLALYVFGDKAMGRSTEAEPIPDPVARSTYANAYSTTGGIKIPGSAEWNQFVADSKWNGANLGAVGHALTQSLAAALGLSLTSAINTVAYALSRLRDPRGALDAALAELNPYRPALTAKFFYLIAESVQSMQPFAETERALRELPVGVREWARRMYEQGGPTDEDTVDRHLAESGGGGLALIDPSEWGGAAASQLSRISDGYRRRAAGMVGGFNEFGIDTGEDGGPDAPDTYGAEEGGKKKKKKKKKYFNKLYDPSFSGQDSGVNDPFNEALPGEGQAIEPGGDGGDHAPLVEAVNDLNDRLAESEAREEQILAALRDIAFADQY